MFDGSSHGEWICGQDSRAHRGVGRRRQRTRNSRYLDVPKYELIDNQLYAVSTDTKFPLNNLLIHSKELYFFQLGTNPRFRKTLAQIKKEHSSHATYLNLFGFFFCLRSNLRIWISSMTSQEAWMRILIRIKMSTKKPKVHFQAKICDLEVEFPSNSQEEKKSLTLAG